jgi:exopolysaccharide biosynthesis polyprenyl glycosylphosphotransferase
MVTQSRFVEMDRIRLITCLGFCNTIMKKSELIFSAVLVPIDWIFLLLAGLFAYVVRFHPRIVEIRPIIFELPLVEYFEIILYVATFWIFIFALSGLYYIKSRRSILREIVDVALACSAGLLLVILYIFSQREFFSSRFIVLVGFVAAIIFVSIGRIIVRLIQRKLYAKGIGLHNLLLIGDSAISERIASEYSSNASLGYAIIKHIKHPADSIMDDVKQLSSAYKIDDILYVDNQEVSSHKVSELVNWASLRNIVFHFSSDYLQLPKAGVDIVSVAGIPIMEFKKTTIDGWGRILKRVFDIIFSLVIILVLAIPMGIISIIIKFSSRGPILFSKKDEGEPLKRVGQYGKPFTYFKFRTMNPNSDNLRYSKELQDKNLRKNSPLVKFKEDPRITTIGKWLRRFSLDELPELFLVVIGRMSLVGPRPHLPEEVSHYTNYQKTVLTIRPGMTGLSQISGRSDIEFDEEVTYDIYYIQNWSLMLDIQILIKTIPAVLRKREAV